jgi:hypothetical protein
VRTYPQETDWLQDHLLFSGALRTRGGTPPERKERARESLLSRLAHSADASYLPARPRIAFTIAQLAIIIVSFLALTVGAAAAGGVNLRSVPRRVVDAIAQPLPLSAQPIHAWPAAQADENAGNHVIDAGAADSDAPYAGSREDGAEQSGSEASADTSTVIDAPVTDLLVHNPAASAPESTPDHREHNPTPTAHPDPAQGEPTGQNPGQSGQPSSYGHNGSNGPSNAAANSHQSPSNGDQTNGPSGNTSVGANGGSSDQNSGDSNGSHHSTASKGGSK